MRYFKMLVYIIIIAVITACGSSTSISNNVTNIDEGEYNFNRIPYTKLSYSIKRKDWNKEVGNFEIFLQPKESGGITIEVEKFFSEEFLTAINEPVENKRIYIIDNNFSLISLNETEKIGSDDRLEYVETINYNTDHTVVNKVIKGKKEHKSTTILPPNAKIFSKDMGMISLMFDEYVENNKFYFFLDSSGMILNYQLVKTEFIKTDNYGEKEALKLHATYPTDTYIWIDKYEHIILKKEEHLQGDVILITDIINKN